uniref:Fructosamine 3 kinase related protein n=1 Tax=Ovis aries TaxID=9940 RepID=A0AC11E1P8_SHEEP
MEELLKRELGCGSVKATGHSGGGCISQGQSYDTDKGRVFVKVNPKAEGYCNTPELWATLNPNMCFSGSGLGGWTSKNAVRPPFLVWRALLPVTPCGRRPRRALWDLLQGLHPCGLVTSQGTAS